MVVVCGDHGDDEHDAEPQDRRCADGGVWSPLVGLNFAVVGAVVQHAPAVCPLSPVWRSLVGLNVAVVGCVVQHAPAVCPKAPIVPSLTIATDWTVLD